MNAQQRTQRWLLVLLTALLMGLIIIYVIPSIAFRITYAIKAGEYQARADVARGQLGDLKDTSEAFRLAVDAVSPAVVYIECYRATTESTAQGPFGNPGSQPLYQQADGSGVIVDAEHGYILTNYHVVSDSELIQVHLADSRWVRAPAERMMVGTGDAPTDLAVLKIDADALVAVPWGDSDALAIGDWVLAIGNPFGLDRSVTAGIVSAKGRAFLPVGNIDYQQFIQTDAAINPGNSGGPLVNLRGELVGINTALVGPNRTNVGIGFAIPSSIAQVVFERLVKEGKVVRGWLGVELEDVDADLAQTLGRKQAGGALVVRVVEGDPADRAGINAGDIIVSFDGKPVSDSNNLRNRVSMTEVGRVVPAEVARNGKILTLEVEIGNLQQPGQAGPLDFEVGELPVEAVARGFTGVQVTEVTPGGQAARNGLSVGDVILRVGIEPVESVAEFNRAVASVRAGSLRVFLVQKPDGSAPFLITLP